jgi:hypothetical protein
MIDFENMNYYLVKGRIVKSGNTSIEGYYLIETNFDDIDIYCANIGYTKIKNIESIMIDGSIYNMENLKHYCQHLIKLSTLYLNLPK